MLDAERLGRDHTARATLARTTRAAVPYLPPRAMPRNEHAQPGEDFSQHAWDESYTLPENQFLAWHMTGERTHLQLGRRFLYDEFFAALARGDNALPGKHAYSHVNALSSAAQAYLSLGDPMYLAAAQQGFEMIAAQSFATGGWGPDEHFVIPGSGALGASLGRADTRVLKPPAAPMRISNSRAICCASPATRATATAWSACSTTRCSGAIPIQPDGHAFYYSDYTRRGQKNLSPRPMAVLLRARCR